LHFFEKNSRLLPHLVVRKFFCFIQWKVSFIGMAYPRPKPIERCINEFVYQYYFACQSSTNIPLFFIYFPSAFKDHLGLQKIAITMTATPPSRNKGNQKRKTQNSRNGKS
jgi:hypothetical protein